MKNNLIFNYSNQQNILSLTNFTIIIAGILFFHFSCTEDNPVIPPDKPPTNDTTIVFDDTLTITIQETDFQYVVIHITNTANNDSSITEIYRIDENTEPFIAAAFYDRLTDTLFKDTDRYSNLKPNTTYSYFGVSRNDTGYIYGKSDTVTTTTRQPVSHQFDWTVHEFGDAGEQNLCDDLWVLDENNVFFTGLLVYNSVHYGVVKWNGSSFEPHKKIGSSAIFGFSESDIWTAENKVYQYDGSDWNWIDGYSNGYRSFPLDTVLFENTSYHGIWGTSSNNLYFTSRNGNIIHWNGSKASISYSDNDIYIGDIHGLDENHIVATATYSTPPARIFIYNGSNWTNYKPDEFLNLRIYSVYYESENAIYLAGTKLFKIEEGNLSVEVQNPPSTFLSIRGNRETKEKFAVGRDMFYHFDGVEWRIISDQLNTDGVGIIGAELIGDKLFLLGYNRPTGKTNLYIGVRK